MEVYLIRHGIACDRSEYPTDEQRPLTDKGKIKTRKVAKRLQSIGLNFDLILTSPLLRAKQTANILQEEGLAPNLEKFPPLTPSGDIHLWVNWKTVKTYNAIALVGHQPDLGNWAEQLLCGHASEKITVKKAGIVGLRVPNQGNPLGNSELFLLTSPKWLLG